jgi:hypothetical protein
MMRLENKAVMMHGRTASGAGGIRYRETDKPTG